MKLQVTNGAELLAAMRGVDAFFRDNDDFTEGGEFPVPEFIVAAREAMDNATKEKAMNANDECPFCKNGTLEKNGEDLVCRGECGILVSAEFQLGYNVGHSAGRRSHPASRSFMKSLQREVAVIAAALETPGDLTDAELVQVIGDAGDLAADLEKDETFSSLWLDDTIQFARLLSEMGAIGLPDGDNWDALLENMDLSRPELDSLFDRAHTVFESSKETT